MIPNVNEIIPWDELAFCERCKRGLGAWMFGRTPLCDECIEEMERPDAE